MKLAEIDRHIRAFRRYNEDGSRVATPPRKAPTTPEEEQVGAALRSLTWCLRDKLNRRCAPFIPPARRPRAPSSFRLVP